MFFVVLAPWWRGGADEYVDCTVLHVEDAPHDLPVKPTCKTYLRSPGLIEKSSRRLVYVGKVPREAGRYLRSTSPLRDQQFPPGVTFAPAGHCIACAWRVNRNRDLSRQP